MNETTAPPGPALGLDLGDSRIGVAVSDPDRRLAIPLGTVEVGVPPGELRSIANLVREHDATVVVIGLPLSMAGEHGSRARQVEAFADALRDTVPVAVELQDERLSTVEAERILRSAGVTGHGRRAVVDRTAAALILQAWLDASAG